MLRESGDSWCNVSCVSFELGLVSLVGHQSSSIRSTCCNMKLHRVPSVGMPRKRVDSTFSDGSCRHAVFFLLPFLSFSISCLFPLLFLFPLLMSIPITATLWTVHWVDVWINIHPLVGTCEISGDIMEGGPCMPCMLLLKLLEHVYDCLCHSKPGGLFSSFFFFFLHGWVCSVSLLADWFGCCYDISITGNLILSWSLNSFTVDSTHKVFEKFSVLMKIFANMFQTLNFHGCTSGTGITVF